MASPSCWPSTQDDIRWTASGRATRELKASNITVRGTQGGLKLPPKAARTKGPPRTRTGR
jgi:hypothetical protein